jgi:hypothetical protein
LHEQQWVKDEMKLYHEKIDKLVPFYCDKCHERWPSYLDYCQLCKKDPMMFTKISQLSKQKKIRLFN